MRTARYKAPIGAVLAIGLVFSPAYAQAADNGETSSEVVETTEVVTEEADETPIQVEPAQEEPAAPEEEAAVVPQEPEPAQEPKRETPPKQDAAPAPQKASDEAVEKEAEPAPVRAAKQPAIPVKQVAPVAVLDTERPVVQDVVIPAVFNPNSVQVVIQATDNVELAKITGNIRKGSASGQLVKSTSSVASGLEASHTVNLSGLADGIYNLRYNASDAEGNISVTKNVDFRIDTTRPTVTIKDGAVFSNDRTRVLSFKLYDAGKIDYVTLNGVRKDLTDSQWSDLNSVRPGIFGAVEGKNTLIVFDVAGNSTELVFTLDTTGPTLTVKPESVGADGFYQTVSFKLNDPAKVAKSYLNGVEKVYTPNVWSDLNSVRPGTFGAVEGKNTLILEDALGNQSTHEFFLDTTKPVVTASIPSRLSTVQTTSLEINATDNLQLAKVVANIRDASGVIVKPTQSQVQGTEATHVVDISGLAEGVYSIRFNALDTAGNLSATKEFSFEVDNTGPRITWQLQPEASYAAGDGFHVRPITDEIGTLKEVYINSVQPESLVRSLQSDHKNFDTKDSHNEQLWASLEDGEYVFIAVFVDDLGNRTESASNSFVISRTPPVVEEEEGPVDETPATEEPPVTKEPPVTEEPSAKENPEPVTPEIPVVEVPEVIVPEDSLSEEEPEGDDLVDLPVVIDYVVQEKPVVKVSSAAVVEKKSTNSEGSKASKTLAETGASLSGLFFSVGLTLLGAAVMLFSRRKSTR